jgi:hypothetical protein
MPAEDRGQLTPGLGCVDERNAKCARSFAIRVRKVGSGAVEGSSSRQASKGGHSRPHGDVLANPMAVSKTCSATAVISGYADA